MGTDGELTPIGEQIEKLIQYLVAQAGRKPDKNNDKKQGGNSND